VFFAPAIPSTNAWIHFGSQALVTVGLIYMASTTRPHLIITGGLGLTSLIIELIQVVTGEPLLLDNTQFIIFDALLLYVLWLMAVDLFTAKVADATTLLLAVNCYLVTGLVWAVFYVLVYEVDPAAFVLTGDPADPAWKHLYYFSFVTLTTLGYGDIQPVSALARSLAVAEATTGVLFTAVVVARLVGLYGARGGDY
jgi:hypothetical protein